MFIMDEKYPYLRTIDLMSKTFYKLLVMLN